MLSGRRLLSHLVRRSLHRSPVCCHDHSKGIIGRDEGFLEERPADWWPERPEIPEDAPEVDFEVILASGNSRIQLKGKEGETVEDVCKREGLLEGACDGNCQCSTCHVFLPEQSDRQKLNMPEAIEDFELDMLELAAQYEDDPEASRLACQLVLEPRLRGLVVKLPRRWNNYMDHIPLD